MNDALTRSGIYCCASGEAMGSEGSNFTTLRRLAGVFAPRWSRSSAPAAPVTVSDDEASVFERAPASAREIAEKVSAPVAAAERNNSVAARAAALANTPIPTSSSDQIKRGARMRAVLTGDPPVQFAADGTRITIDQGTARIFAHALNGDVWMSQDQVQHAHLRVDGSVLYASGDVVGLLDPRGKLLERRSLESLAVGGVLAFHPTKHGVLALTRSREIVGLDSSLRLMSCVRIPELLHPTSSVRLQSLDDGALALGVYTREEETGAEQRVFVFDLSPPDRAREAPVEELALRTCIGARTSFSTADYFRPVLPQLCLEQSRAVFVGGDHLTAVDLDSQVKWRLRLPGVKDMGVLDDGALLVAHAAGAAVPRVSRVDADGTVRWSFEIEDRMARARMVEVKDPGQPQSARPETAMAVTVHQETVYLQFNGGILAMRCTDGAPVWGARMDERSVPSGVAVAPDGRVFTHATAFE